MVVAGVQFGPGPVAAAAVGAAVGFPGGPAEPGGPGAAPAAVAVEAAAAAAAADVMYEEKAVLGPLRVRIVVVAVVAGTPDDAGRVLPTVGGLVGVDASMARCGGATGEPDEYSPVDLGSTLMCGSFGSTGITASGWVFFMCRSMLPRSTYDLLHCGQWWFFSPV